MRLAPLVCATLLLGACRRPTPPGQFGFVPQFTLTDERGQPFSRQDLDGKVWVADFIYTTCQGPCPRMSAQMRQIQNASAVHLVSFTVDPAHDTPEVLAAYAKRWQADPARWRFLTGSAATLNLLNRDAFHLGDLNAGLEHSTRFVLVDARARIRGYYNTWESDSIKRLLADIDVVRKESP